ncbi:MAG: hypothetical protein ABSA40_08515 [Candidatus Dormibacteria bacterium]
MEDEGIEPELDITPIGTRMWGFGEVLGVSLLVAATLIAVGSIAAGLLTAGASPAQNQVEVDLLYTTQWITPFIVLFPLAALATAWWRVRPDGPDAATDAGAGSPGAARGVVMASGALLVVVVCGAVGAMVSTLLLIHASNLAGNEVWPSGAQTLSEGSAALVLAIVGIVWVSTLLVRMSNRPVSAGEDEIADAADLTDLEESPVTITAPA